MLENIHDNLQSSICTLLFLMHVDAAISDMKEDSGLHQQQLELQYRDLFRPFRCFCARKDVGN